MNQVLSAGGACVDVGNAVIHFLALGVSIAGLVICILNMRLSKSMILLVVGFGGEIAVWLLPQLIAGLYRLTSIGPEVGLVLSFFSMFINLCGPASAGLIVFGLFQVFRDMKKLKGEEIGKPARRRRDDDEDEEEERPAPRPKKPGSRDVQR